MIREAVRIVFRMEGERAVNNFKLYLEEWKELDFQDAKRVFKKELPFHLAEVIVALTKEEAEVEYARGNAIKNATKIANLVKMTLHRKVGRHENLLITLSDDKIYDRESFVSAIDSLIKLVSSHDFTLDELINKGSLMLASMLHISGLSEIDVHASSDIDITVLQ